MFSASVQPAIISLLSSSGSQPLGLWRTETDASLPSDSFVTLLNDTSSQPCPPPPQTLIATETAEEGTSPDYTLDHTVIHIQSPTLQTTYIRCPPNHDSSSSRDSHGHLGMKHPWVHLQVRNMGREWAFELGVVDQAGREGVIRCATFQRVKDTCLMKQPKLKLTKRPLLILPLSFPPSSSRPLTSWSTVSLNLPSLLPHFSSAALSGDEDPELSSHREGPTRGGTQVPSGTYSHVSYVKVYATCRLRRVWFSEGGPQQRLPWEFQLYGSDMAA